MTHSTDIKRIFFWMATWLMHRIREPQRILIIFIFLFIPLIATFSLVIVGFEKKIAGMRDGQVGVMYLRQTWPFLQHLQQHRGLSSAYLSGDESFRPRMLEMEAEINADIQAFSVVERAYGNVNLNDTLSGSEFLKTRWDELQKNVWTLTPEESFKQHSALTEATISLMNMVVDSSGLFLNADGTTYYLVSMITGGLPSMTEWLGKMRAFGLSLQTGEPISAVERRTLTGFSALASSSLQKIRDEAKVSSHNDPYVQMALSDPLEDAIKQADDFLTFVETNIILTNTNTADATDYYTLATNVIDSLFGLYDTSAAILYNLQEDTIRDTRESESAVLVIVVGMVAIGAYLFYGAYSISSRRTKKYL